MKHFQDILVSCFFVFCFFKLLHTRCSVSHFYIINTIDMPESFGKKDCRNMTSRKLSMQNVDVKMKVCICQYYLQQLCPQKCRPRSHQNVEEKQ